MSALPAPIFIGCFFSFVLMLVLLSYQLRRRKYRRIAHELGAQYKSQGMLNSGKIAGVINQRKYEIETRDRGRAGTWTSLTMECSNKGISLHIHAHFFKPFPNWKYAFKLGDRDERAFFAHIELQGVSVPLEEKYRIGVQNLFRQFSLPNYGFLRKGYLRIDQQSVTFTSRGALRKSDAVLQTLSMLTAVVDRIEGAPVLS